MMVSTAASLGILAGIYWTVLHPVSLILPTSHLQRYAVRCWLTWDGRYHAQWYPKPL